MAQHDSTIRDALVVDNGPVKDAALILSERSTLAGHVTVTVGDYTTEIAVTDDIPYAVWGSGTQALWRLLSSIAYTSEQVSLYEVVSRLDARNREAVALAVAALCGIGATAYPSEAERTNDLLERLARAGAHR